MAVGLIILGSGLAVLRYPCQLKNVFIHIEFDLVFHGSVKTSAILFSYQSSLKRSTHNNSGGYCDTVLMSQGLCRWKHDVANLRKSRISVYVAMCHITLTKLHKPHFYYIFLIINR